MSNASLSQIWLGTKFEASLGGGSADIATTAALAAFLNCDIKPAFADEGIAEATGWHPVKDSTRVGKACSGSISGPVGATLLAYFLKYLFMVVPTPTGAGDPYTLTWADPLTPNSGTALFTPAAMPEKSFSLIEQIARISGYGVSPKGLIATSLAITWTSQGKVTATLTVAGNGVYTTGVSSPTTPTDDHGRYLLGAMTTLSIGGSDVSTALRGGTLTISNGMEWTPRGGSTAGELTAIDQSGQPNVELTFDLDETAIAANGGLDDYLNTAGAPYGSAVAREYILVFKGDTNRTATFTIKAGKVEGEYDVKVGANGTHGVQRKVKAYQKAGTLYEYLDVVALGKFDLAEA